jgi:hypothetical protein
MDTKPATLGGDIATAGDPVAQSLLIFRDPTLRSYATLAFDLQTKLRNSTTLLSLHLAPHPAAPASRTGVPRSCTNTGCPWYLALASWRAYSC